MSITQNLLTKVVPLVNYLGDKPYLCGSNLTYVDFIFFELCDFMNWIAEGQLFTKFPTLQAYFDRIKGEPKLAEFYADDVKCIKSPYNNKIAKLNN